MGFTDAVKNAMLDLIDETGGSQSITHVSLHTADPGTTGANEVTGGSYARVAVTWGDAASGIKANTGDLEFNVPSGTTVTHVGGWSASSGGTFRGGGEVVDGNGDAVEQEFTLPGTCTIGAGDLKVTV